CRKLGVKNRTEVAQATGGRSLLA
ncbi:MAG: hypothetical protein JWO02_2363, partial [Solirubrobacterales bacterium]|nr:hypothetical protein [Solirubrobacterales bacterium]